MNKNNYTDDNNYKYKECYRNEKNDSKKVNTHKKRSSGWNNRNEDLYRNRYSGNRINGYDRKHLEVYNYRNVTNRENKNDYYKRRRSSSRSNSRTKSRSRSSSLTKSSERYKYIRKRRSKERNYSLSFEKNNNNIINKVKMDLEYSNRDDLTVLILNLHLNAQEYDVYEFFTSFAGSVRDIRIIRDNRSGRSKGVCYVEFYNIESVLKALKLSGQKIMNSPITIQASQAEKNRAAKLAKIEEIKAETTPLILKVNGLVEILSKINHDELKSLFSTFGKVLKIDIKRDMYSDEHLGYAFVEFEKAIEGYDAMKALDNFEIAGKRISVEISSENSGIKLSKDIIKNCIEYNNSDMVEKIGENQDTTKSFNLNNKNAIDRNNKVTMKNKPYSEIDKKNDIKNKDVAKVDVNNKNDINDINKSAIVDLLPEFKTSENKLLNKNSSCNDNKSTNCLLMSNLFTIESLKESMLENEEEFGEKFTEEQILDEILKDVEEECSKYGKIVRCFMERDLNKIDGNVWIQYENNSQSENAKKIFDGRYFGGRQITVKYINENDFP
ncbi:splicing factor [Cryptosporidium ryanae]|uniref:splicing factor n=1 Tax=Cryptosporidium ryanae TaxID=515981 RepID=UPI00351A2BB9|nr:splicing factor [Cryptosporidium ryanae]